MEKAATSGQFRSFVGGLLTTKDDTVAMMDGALIQKAIDKCGSGMTQAELVKWINNGCRLTTVLANAFTVGDIFRHRAEKGDRRLYLSDNTQNWAIIPNLKKVIPIRTDLGKLSEYTLPHSMNDSSIQTNAGNPGFMELEVFLCVMYLLIFQPNLAEQVLGYTLRKDKWYLFHVMVDGKKVAFCVYWVDDEWYFDARGFDYGVDWGAGLLFLSFDTV
jgi:hypothetical protein